MFSSIIHAFTFKFLMCLKHERADKDIIPSHFLNSYNMRGCPCPTVSPSSIKYGLNNLRLSISTSNR